MSSLCSRQGGGLSQRTFILSLLEVSLSNPGLMLLLKFRGQLRIQITGPVLRITGSRSDTGIYPVAREKYISAQSHSGQRGAIL